jgi:hypothetical protein
VPPAEHVPTTSTTVVDGPSPTPTTTNQDHGEAVLTVKIRQPSHEFTFGVGMTFVSYPLVLTPVV